MHAEALTKESAALLPKFSQFKTFYLVGGTALALQIGHRLSVDFDLFSSHELSPRLSHKIRRVFSPLSIKVTYRNPEQLNVLLNGIKTTFFYYPYPVSYPTISFRGLPIASIPEIAAMKAFSIGKRLSYKDYVDWYFMLREKRVGLRQVITLARKKFNGEFNARLFLGQIVSLTDVPTLQIDFLRDAVDRRTIESFLKKTVRAFKI